MRMNSYLVCFATILTSALTPGAAIAATNFVQKNLVADTDGVADHTDPNLVGTWGVSTSPGSPFWVSNTAKGTSTLYDSAGVPNARVVVVPPSANNKGKSGTPTGQVWNGLGVFEVAAGKVPSFIFATLDGTISGWNSTVGDGNTAVVMVDNGAKGESPGDIRTFGGDVFQSGKRVGHDRIRCVVGATFNSQVWIGRSSLIANGFVARGPSFTAKITGGTGKYKGARGTVSVVGGPTTKYTVRLAG